MRIVGMSLHILNEEEKSNSSSSRFIFKNPSSPKPSCASMRHHVLSFSQVSLRFRLDLSDKIETTPFCMGRMAQHQHWNEDSNFDWSTVKVTRFESGARCDIWFPSAFAMRRSHHAYIMNYLRNASRDFSIRFFSSLVKVFKSIPRWWTLSDWYNMLQASQLEPEFKEPPIYSRTSERLKRFLVWWTQKQLIKESETRCGWKVRCPWFKAVCICFSQTSSLKQYH